MLEGGGTHRLAEEYDDTGCGNMDAEGHVAKGMQELTHAAGTNAAGSDAARCDVAGSDVAVVGRTSRIGMVASMVDVICFCCLRS